MAEHLGVESHVFAEKITATQSLIRAIEALQGGERSLKPLEPRVDPQLDGIMPDFSVIDPERPVDADQLADEFISGEERQRAGSRIVLIVVTLILVSGLAAVWRWTPLQSWANRETLVHAATLIQDSPAAPLWDFCMHLPALSLAPHFHSGSDTFSGAAGCAVSPVPA